MGTRAPWLHWLTSLSLLAMLLASVGPTAALSGTDFESSDGNLVADSTRDWATIAGGVAVGTDLPTGQTDNSFTQGSKEDTINPVIEYGSIPNNKSNLLRFYAYDEKVGGKDYLYIAWVRDNTLGTANMDFEFNHVSPPASGTPRREPGDILITFDFASGGNRVELGLSTWTASGPCEANGAKPPCWGSVKDLDYLGYADGRVNDGFDALDPIAGTTLADKTFGEAAINLTDTVFKDGACKNFGSAYLKSRSSDSFTAALKDFIAPIPVTISNCGEIAVSKYIDVDADGIKDSADPPGQGASFTVTGPAPSTEVVCTGATDSTGKLVCSTGSLLDLQPGSYTITETQQAGYFNSDPGPKPNISPTVSRTVTVTIDQETAVAFGNACYIDATLTVNSVPSSVSGLFIWYESNGGSRVDLTPGVSSGTATATVNDTFFQDDSVEWGYGINHGAAGEQILKVGTVDLSLGTYPSCARAETTTFPTATLSGSKYKDANANGTHDPGEPGLSGFVFELVDSGSTVVQTATSGADGSYQFTSVTPGDYTVREQAKTGWRQTEPASAGARSVTVGLGQTSAVIDVFGNTPLSTITVTFTPQTSPAATHATAIACTDQAGNPVGSATNSNTLTTGDLTTGQSTVTCTITFVDP